jgi:hypothetical protein
MPVEQRSGSSQVVAIVIGVVTVVVAVAAAWGLIALASGGDGPVRIQLGDETFDAGQASRLARQIERKGPVLFSDVSGRGQRRPIFVSHFGDDPELQWYAFSATAPGTEADQGCFLFYNAERRLFEARLPNEEDFSRPGEVCAEGTWSATGEGLEQFPWRVDDAGDLIIDLRDGPTDPSSDDTTSDDSSTTTSAGD